MSPTSYPAMDTTLSPSVAAATQDHTSSWRTGLLGLQHVIVMYTGCVAVPLVFGSAVGLDTRDRSAGQR